MKHWKTILGWLLLAGLMGWTAWTLFRGSSAAAVWSALKQVRPGTVLLGLALMTGFILCEAACTRRILAALGHKTTLSQAMGYSAAGFYFSSVTPSASGGQPAQVLAMRKDGIPLAHGTLDMLLVTVCYQTMTLLFAAGAWFLLPGAADLLGVGLGALLLFGGLTTLVLTAGMLLLLVRPPKSPRFDDYRAAAALIRSRPALLPRLLGLTALQLLCLYLVPYVVYRGFGLNGASALQLVGMQALLSLATGCLPLPGAVGAAEGAFLRGFTHFFGADLVTPAVLVSRGISFYLPLLCTGLITLSLRLRRRQTANPLSRRPPAAPLKASSFARKQVSRPAS